MHWKSWELCSRGSGLLGNLCLGSKQSSFPRQRESIFCGTWTPAFAGVTDLCRGSLTPPLLAHELPCVSEHRMPGEGMLQLPPVDVEQVVLRDDDAVELTIEDGP